MASILLRNPGMAKLTPHKEDCEVLAQVTQLIHHLAQRALSVAESVGHDALKPLGFNDDWAVGVVQNNGFSVLDIFSPVTTAFLEFSASNDHISSSPGLSRPASAKECSSC